MEHAGISGAADDAPFKLKPLPIILTLLLCAGLYFISSITLDGVEHFKVLPERPAMPWIHESYIHIVQLGYALLIIYLLRRTYPETYGLQWPEGRSYVGWAILCGVAFGLLMTLVDYWPQVLAQAPPRDNPYSLTGLNVTGWILYKGLLAGPSAEVVFRGLLLTFLTQRMPGRISWRGYEINGAGVVVAVLYALSFSEGFIDKPFVFAFSQFMLAFAMGVLFAYWLEKSKSLVAPIIGNSASGMIEQALVFVMVAAWH